MSSTNVAAKLESHLQNRPQPEDLFNRHILKVLSANADAKLLPVMVALEAARGKTHLSRLIQRRQVRLTRVIELKVYYVFAYPFRKLKSSAGSTRYRQ
jgi:hypothetical protein